MTNFDIPGLSDITEHGDKLVMPFKPYDYGEDNHILRLCCICERSVPQNTLKELGVNKDEGLKHIYSDHKKFWPRSIFFCYECWVESDYSDAANWTA